MITVRWMICRNGAYSCAEDIWQIIQVLMKEERFRKAEMIMREVNQDEFDHFRC